MILKDKHIEEGRKGQETGNFATDLIRENVVMATSVNLTTNVGYVVSSDMARITVTK